MPNNVAISITADVAGATANLALARAEATATTKTLNDLAKQVQTTARTPELESSFLAAADAAAKARSQVALATAELRRFAPAAESVAVGGAVAAAEMNGAAVAAGGLGHASAGVTRELLVMGRELANGNFNRMAGSATILAGRLNLLSPAFISAGVAAAALAIPLVAMSGYFDTLFDKQAQEVEKLQEQQRASELTQKAQEQFQQTAEGVTKAIYDQKAALEGDVEALKSEAEKSYESAKANLENEKRIRAVTEALAERAQAEYRSAQAQTFGAGGAASAGMVAAMYGSQARKAVDTAKKAQDDLAQAQKNLVQAQANLSIEAGRRMADPVEQIKKKYEGSGGLIDAARQRAIAEGKTGIELQNQVQALAEQEKAELANAKDKRKGRSSAGRDDTVQQWTEQLRAQEIVSKDFFRDQTADELKFWQGKLTLVQAGGKDWLQVQSRIFDAQRTLARQGYQDQIADYNERLAADRDNWAREQADWDAKLGFIKAKQGELSREYKIAYTEMERAQHEHAEKDLRDTETGIKSATDLLKRGLDAQAKVREDDAKAAEEITKGNAGGSLFGEIAATRQVAVIHADLTAQKIADNDRLYQAESQQLDEAIAKAKAAGQTELAAYQSLLAQKAAADERYADTKRTLEAQQRQQAIADIEAQKNAFQSYISGTVNATITGFDRMISGQQSWKQFGIAIYGSVVHEFESQIAKMVSNWIVSHLLMSGAQKAQLAVQTSAQTAAAATNTATSLAANRAISQSYVGVAGAAGVASMAAAPFPLDLGAPAFGAAMSAAAQGFAVAASFDKGTNMLPRDMIAQVHAGERIVPAADNAKLMELTARGAGQGNGGGDTHIHFSPTIHGGAAPDVIAALENNFGDFKRMVRNAARAGAF